jgi:hypothetical protein
MTAQRHLPLAPAAPRRRNVSSAEWRAAVMRALDVYSRAKSSFTCEEFRADYLSRGYPNATTPHVWGAVFRAAVGAGVLVHTGEWRPARSPRTRKHRVAIYARAKATPTP